MEASDIEDRSTSSPGASHSLAKMYLQPERCEELSAAPDQASIERYLGSLARYDLDTSCWRTSQGCLWTGGSEPFSGIWPRSGLIRNGTAFRRRPLVPIISMIGFSFWPTPNAANGRKMCADESPASWAVHRLRHLLKGQRKQLSLPIAAKSFPSGPIPKCQESMMSQIVNRAQNGPPWQNDGWMNPEWDEWLMGFPAGWTDIDV